MPRDFLDPYSRGDSVCHRLPDRLKIFFVLAIVIAAVSIPPQFWPLHGCLAALIYLAMSIAGVPTRYLLVRLMFLMPMLIGLGVAVPASNGFVRGWDVMAALVMRSCVSFMAVLWLVNVTPFDRLLVALRKLGLPRVLAAILAFMYRYVFVVFDELQRMREARRARSFGRRSMASQWKSNGQLIGLLLIRSMNRAERVHGAMCARGFDGEIRTLDG